MGNGITGSILKMQSAGFSDDQVEAITEYIDSGAATKADIAELKGQLRLVHWMVGLTIAIGLANLYLILRLLQVT